MNNTESKRYKLIGCEILFREICFCAAMSRNIIDLTFMPKGLHDVGRQGMSARLQAEIDGVDAEWYGAVLLCYGLCNNGVAGLRSKLPLVVPRAHDCITLLMGSKERYSEYFYANPGTFFKSAGWIERDEHPNGAEGTIPSQLGMGKTMAEYIEEYGEENAEFLMEILGDWTKNYSKIAYIDTGVGDSAALEARSIEDARGQNWSYERLEGSTRLIQALMDGDWDEREFLVVPAGETIEPTGGEDIIERQ